MNMANAPVIRIGGTDYNIKDLKARQDISVLKSNLDKLNNGFTGVPYINLYNAQNVTVDKSIASSGAIVDSDNTVITDYIPVKLADEAYYEGIASISDIIFAACYNENKELIGTFQRQMGKQNLDENAIYRNTRYVRFTLNYVQYNERNDFKLYSKKYTTQDESETTKEDLIDYIDQSRVHSPNLLDHDTDSVGYELIAGTGEISEYATYYVSDFIEVTPGEEYVQLIFSSMAQYYVYRAVGAVCFYDKYKKYISGFERTSEHISAIVPEGAKYLRFTAPSTTYRNLDMFGRKLYMDKKLDIGEDAYTPAGVYSTPVTIYSISKPYINYSWRGYWSFKFYSVMFKEFDGSTNGVWFEYLKKKYPSRVESNDTEYVRQTMNIENGESLVYSFKKKVLEITTTPEPNDIIILSIIQNKPFGELLNAYNNELVFGQLKPYYTTIPDGIKKQIDDRFESTGLLTAATKTNIFTFAHVSDNHHIGTYGGKSPDLTGLAIKHCYSRLKFDAIFNTGDELLTATQSASGLGYNDGKVALSNAINAYPIEDLVFAEGNHDRGIIDEQYITHAEYYNLVIRHWKDNPNVVSEYPNAYYYRDYPQQKIRAICVTLYNMPDSDEDQYPYNDYCGYDQAQMEWLVNEALQVENGWAVIILVHSAPVTTAEGNTGNGSAGQNPLVLRQILESFKNGTNQTVTHSSTEAGGFFNINITTDFADQGARSVIGVLSGHTHIDRLITINGITYDAICCGYIDIVEYSGNRGTRNQYEYSAVCFDVGTINLQTKTVSLYRIGFVPSDSQESRTWTY